MNACEYEAILPEPVMAYRNFIDLWRMDAGDLRQIIDCAHAMKQARAGRPKGQADDGAPFNGHTLAMIFQKSSTRTRFSFDMAMTQLGGRSIIASAADMQLDRGETPEDTARVLGRYVDAVMIRANAHDMLNRFADHAGVPVINGLSDDSHPCQTMADLMTLEEHGITLAGARLAWVGDGSNVCTSLIEAAPMFGYSLAIATPAGHAPASDCVETARRAGAQISLHDEALQAVRGADAVFTDTFVSMGSRDRAGRLMALIPYRVSADLMQAARPGAKFLHCLPVHRGEEVAADVIDGVDSLVWDEAENRLHVQKAILRWCLDK